jgi:hypothetical protein
MRYERSIRLATLVAIAILAALTLVSSAPAGVPAPLSGDHYLCYTARKARAPRGEPPFPAFEPRSGVAVVDALASGDPEDRHLVDLKKPATLCLPVDKNGEGIADALTHLEGYKATRTRMRPSQPRFAKQARVVENQLGRFDLLLKAGDDLLVPSAALEGSGGAPALAATAVPHFRCYKARAARGTPGPAPTPRTLTLADTFGERLFLLRKPTRLCLPADKNGEDPGAADAPGSLLCWAAQPARANPPSPRFASRFVSTHNQLGVEVVRLTKELELCVPSRDPAASPSPTPAPTGTAAGTPVLAPTPTMTPGPLGTPSGTLERISLRPPVIARLPGEMKHFFATGHYSDGSTFDISDQLVYSSSDPAVGVAANDPNDPNRIDILAEGTTMIAAHDPVSGVSSADSGDDAMLIATGPLQSIAITPTPWSMLPGDSKQFTAIGTYAPDGVKRNLTQDVVWSTIHPAVAVATNPAGNRSRVDAVGTGTTTVTATEPTSGITASVGATLDVFGTLQAIYLRLVEPDDRSEVRAPGTARVRAFGVYQGNAARELTEEVVFASSAPAVVAAPNVPTDPGRLDVTGSGTVEITATHVATGFVSSILHVRGLDGLQSLHFYDGFYTPPVILVGQRARFAVFGVFADGSAGIPPEDLDLLSSDPSIVDIEVVDGRGSFVGMRGGTAMVAAVDRRTGIRTIDVTLHVKGPLERISLTPDTTRRLVGQAKHYLGLAHFEGGVVELVTQELTYASSDPSVAVASNALHDRSKVAAVGPGTAVISATHPSGLSTTDTGDDAVFTVLDTLASIRVIQEVVTRDPGRATYFTAVGTDVNGAQLNLTQDVLWASSHPAVATAPNPIGERSRILPLAPGVARIVATEPLSGLSTTAFDADGTLVVVGALQALTVTPNPLMMIPGQEFQLTVRGDHVGGGTTNLTQDVVYTSGDPTVVEATNLEGHRSHVVALRTGAATIAVVDPLTGIASTDAGGDATVIVITP